MKKILLLLLLLPVFASAQKTTPGNYTYIAQKYEWDAGIYKGLGLPSGSGPAAFITGQVQRAGAVYFDTLGVDAGFYIYNGTAWVLQGTPSVVDLDDELLSGGSVTPQGTGFKLSVQEAAYRISGTIYGSDSGTVTLSGSDPSLNRIDYIYLGTDGAFHVLEGIPGLPAAEPRLENDQLGIAFVSIPAGSTTPGVSTVVVYNENTESTVSNTGTTTDPDNTTNVFTGAKSLNVTNIAANDMIHFTAPITFNASGFDALAIHMLPKAVLASGNRLYVQLFVGSTAVSNEVEIVWNRNNITTYQAISISAQALGTLTNYNVTRVRIRYVGSGANFAGFYFDYIFFQTGTSQPNPPGGGGFPNIIPPATWGVSGNGTQNITITAPGLRDKILRGGGTAETDSTVKYIGDVNSLAKSPNGANINTLTNEVVYQDADIDDRGFMTAELWRVIDTLRRQTIENASLGDTLVYPIDDFRTGVKGLIAGTNVTLVKTDTTITLNATGGSGGFFTPNQTSTGNTLHDADNFDFRLRSEGGITFVSDATTDSVSLSVSNQKVSMYAADALGLTESLMDFGLGEFLFNNHLGTYLFTNLTEPPGSTNKMFVYDSATNKMHVTAIPGGGGGSGTVTNVATGYGVSGGPITGTGTIVADTTSADGLVSKDRLAATIALIDTSNILIERAGDGAGQQSHYIVGDTILFLKDFKNSNSVLWSTDDDSNLIAKVDTFVIATKNRINQVADSLAAAITTGAGIFTVNILSGVNSAMTDAQEIFFSCAPVAVATSATLYPLQIDKACTLTQVMLHGRASTTGTNESWSMYVRVNNTTDYLIEAVADNTGMRIWNNNAMNSGAGISLSPGDEIVIKSINPTWATNPATVTFYGYLTFE